MHAEQVYLFRHVLLREVAYQLQLPADRARLHRLALEATEQSLTDIGGLAFSMARELADHARLAQPSDGPLDPVLAEKEINYLHEALRGANASFRWADTAELCNRLCAHPSASSRTRAQAGKLLAQSLFMRGLTQEALSAVYAALEHTSDPETAHLKPASLHILGLIEGRQGKRADAAATLNRALALAEESGSGHEKAGILVDLGQIAREAGRVREAHELFDRALAHARASHDQHASISAQLNAVTLLIIELRHDQALMKLEEILAQTRAYAHPELVSAAWVNVAAIHHHRRQYPEAISACEKALEHSRRGGIRRTECYALNNLASVYENQDRLDEARLTFEQMLAAATEIGEQTMRASALLNLGIVCRGLKNAQSAFDHLEDAARLSAAIGHVSLEATALGQLGMTHFQQGNLARGIELGEAAVALALKSGDQMNTDRLSGILVGNLLLMGEFARASALLHGQQRQDSSSGESSVALMRQCHLELARAAPFGAVSDRDALMRAIDAANRLKTPSNLQSRDPDLELLLSNVEAARSAFEDGKPALLFRGGSPLALAAPMRAALVMHLKSGDGSAWAGLERTNPALASAMKSPDQPV